ncbi:glycoside hydrolase family 10 protein [Geothrix oryzisoli]|uniref:glycoside hydrolase family 10 protein n=1 Tax=Geothrix oryzisoli TaxID=2922721 RepID=UPI001FAD535E
MVRQSLSRLRALGPCVLLLFVGCLTRVVPDGRRSPANPPPAPREFRAAWVATVANIDWPSRRQEPVEAQQAEVRDIIAKARAIGLNALILQVRPSADALYASPLEPWSEFLTGTQGRPPEPFYDPLAFWIEEAHRAGLELHAWFNPFRVRASSARSASAPNHLSRARPDLVRSYGDQLWLDPGEPGAVDHVVAVILDVVHRYDVDGVHIDDYFYPYPVKNDAGQAVDFPDDPSWRAFRESGGTISRADWRRQNVDRFLERVYREVHREKPYARVGVSPFGLGRPDRRPPGVNGFSQYDELYAHAEVWLERGWVDYLMPQLYWKREAAGQPFGTLLDTWRAQNPKGRPVWPGLFTSRTVAPEPWPAAEIIEQIRLTRSRGGVPGHAHFSMAALRSNAGGIADRLTELYAGPALVPTAEWLGGSTPPPPSVWLQGAKAGATEVRVAWTGGGDARLLALWGRYGEAWRFFTLPAGGGALPARSGGQPLESVRAFSVGPTGLESPAAAIMDQRK